MDVAWAGPEEFLEGSHGFAVTYFKKSLLDLSTLSTQELLFSWNSALVPPRV